MNIVGYFILVFGVIGIGLGAFGVFMPSVRQRGFSLKLPFGRGDDEDVKETVAELEQSGFRNSPFEARIPAPKVVLPVAAPPGRTAPAASAKPTPRPAVATVAAAAPPPNDDDASLALAELEDDEELDPVVAELLAEAQAAQLAVAVEEPAQEEDAAKADEPGGEELSDEMLSLFAETTTESATPEALRNAVPVVTIEELLAQAREVRQLMAQPQGSHSHVA